ncbi:MAG: YqhG family protein [Bacillus sp. (in: firmicutes)]
MQQHDIHRFLTAYFKANGAEILDIHEAYMTVQLTIELDKELMNRPFYWHYLEKTGGQPNPASITFILDPAKTPDHINGELIHFGSPRLHQIFQSAKRMSSYIRLYENRQNDSNMQQPLHPWLAANFKVSFICDRKKDLLFSLGLHLLSGNITENFHEKSEGLSLTPKIPDFSFTLSPIIMPKSGISRLERYVRLKLEEEDHQWAERALTKWNNDLSLLEHFYSDCEEKGESYENEKIALQQQYEPNIHISIINGGMFYLNHHAL